MENLHLKNLDLTKVHEQYEKDNPDKKNKDLTYPNIFVTAFLGFVMLMIMGMLRDSNTNIFEFCQEFVNWVIGK